MALVREILVFAWAVINTWAGYSTGGAIVATIALWQIIRDRPVPRTLLIVLCILFLVMAFFRAWKEQYERAEQSKRQVRQLSVSAITGDIQFGIIGAQETGSHAALIVEVKNSGAASGVLGSSWHLTAIEKSGVRHTGWANTLKDKNLDFCLGPKRLMRFVRADALYLKLLPPLARNESKQGMVWFAFPDLDAETLKDARTSLLLEADTVSGQHISISTTIARLIELSSKPTIIFSGIENPSPLNMPCKEGQSY